MDQSTEMPSKALLVPQEPRKKLGRPKGSRDHPSTLRSQLKASVVLSKAEARNRMVERIIARMGPILEAHLDKAQGNQVLMVKDEDGKWRRLTDADLVETVMNSGPMGETWKIQVQDPDIQAAKYFIDQAIDKAVDRTEVTGAEGEPLVIKWKVG